MVILLVLKQNFKQETTQPLSLIPVHLLLLKLCCEEVTCFSVGVQMVCIFYCKVVMPSWENIACKHISQDIADFVIYYPSQHLFMIPSVSSFA